MNTLQISENAAKMPVVDIARKLGRSCSSVRKCGHRMGVSFAKGSKPDVWTKDELEKLVKYSKIVKKWKDIPLRRSENAVKAKAKELGLTLENYRKHATVVKKAASRDYRDFNKFDHREMIAIDQMKMLSRMVSET